MIAKSSNTRWLVIAVLFVICVLDWRIWVHYKDKVTPEAISSYAMEGSNSRPAGYTALPGSSPDTSRSADTTSDAGKSGKNHSLSVTRERFESKCPIIRIMPLGDSITSGIYGPEGAGPDEPVRGGYRGPLYRLLVDNGYVVDFVGSLSAGFDLVPPIDPDHEGHSGWNAWQMSGGVYEFLQANPPDIILLHIGTNDLVASTTAVKAILDEIDRFEADSGSVITVVLAKIINREPYSRTTSIFNSNLESLAVARIEAGDSLVLVDQESALVYEDNMFDALHPNSVGYDKMAKVWYAELQSLISVCEE